MSDIIKVPIEHFERLIESCCILHRCDENLDKCVCFSSMEEEYNKSIKKEEATNDCTL